MVEARIDGRWILLDPTFGTAFKAAGHYLGLDDLRFEFYGSDLKEFVKQAVPGDWRMADVDELYSGTFNHTGMLLASYSGAEAVGRGDPDEMVALSIPLDLSTGATTFAATGLDMPDISTSWLNLTNATLTDADPENNVSFNTSLFSTNTGRRATIVALTGMVPGRIYRLSLYVWVGEEKRRIQAAAIGRGALLARTDSIPVVLGYRPYDITFRATDEDANILVRSVGAPTWNIRLFGVGAHLLDD